MSFEVEQKFRTAGHAEVAARLAAMGAEAGPRVEHEDAYLNHPRATSPRRTRRFRLRRVGDANAITYKGPKHAGPTKTREEIEIPFAEGPEALGQMRRVFEALGFRDRRRRPQDADALRLTHEAGRSRSCSTSPRGSGRSSRSRRSPTSEADLPEAQRAVMSLAAALGLTEVEPRSYLRMALERAAASRRRGPTARNPAGQT